MRTSWFAQRFVGQFFVESVSVDAAPDVAVPASKPMITKRLVVSGAVPAALHVSVVAVLLAICRICPAAVPEKMNTQ